MEPGHLEAGVCDIGRHRFGHEVYIWGGGSVEQEGIGGEGSALRAGGQRATKGAGSTRRA